ncbi:helix-turn-helix domain-containing protein [Bacillus sp. 1P06AnD]|uniref:helix-turn-helix domain-containing protein n=1 Tax=Bacillus sp. 1P06AnD TaxID=3132208 RepID=UPI0039A298BD
MIHSYLEAIIMDCLLRIGGERTVYSVYHILYGKKSSQTIQDSRFFYIEKYFRTLPSLERGHFQQCIDKLNENGFIHVLNEKGNYRIEEKGREIMRHYVEKNPFPSYMNGFAFHMVAMPFWRRLSFLFQVVSNGVHKNSSYYCIEHDEFIQKWVKKIVFKYNDMQELANALHQELQRILSTRPDDAASIFVLKLTGFHRAGYNNRQIGNRFGVDEYYVHFMFLDTLHLILQHSTEEHTVLTEISEDLFKNRQSPITQSSLSTLSFLKKGYSISEIAVVRQLKESTIEDHIVELALHTSEVQLTRFVDESLADEIRLIAEESQTKQLKNIKGRLSKEATYFQIRLVLAERRG